jgi:tRNA A-37 threonylcarbamoyl transferase component Bud32
LVDDIEDITMADAKPSNFSKSVRQSMLKSIVDLESRIFEKNIWLTDLEPRNVIISSPDSDRPSVVFIDFAHALFNRRRDDPPLLQLNYLDITEMHDDVKQQFCMQAHSF